MEKFLIAFTSMLISACVTLVGLAFFYIVASKKYELLDTMEDPWVAFATDLRTGERVWPHKKVISFRESNLKECRERISWNVRHRYPLLFTEPNGCVYLSNFELPTMLAFQLHSDSFYFACLIRSKDPDSDDWNRRHRLIFIEERDRCINDADQEVLALRTDNHWWAILKTVARVIFQS